MLSSESAVPRFGGLVLISKVTCKFVVSRVTNSLLRAVLRPTSTVKIFVDLPVHHLQAPLPSLPGIPHP